MLGYKNATGDDRRLFMRFLPTPWRNLTDEKNTHNALLGSITTLAETEEADLKQSKDESFLDTASGVFLNKWGNFSGVFRRDNETDEHYRTRIKRWFTKKKGTVNSLVDNILEEFEDDNLDVYIYEPWRNIFYLNRSLLNGVDHLQGHYYRFAVIDIHISENIDVKRLAYIVDRYKDAGVMVYFTYENGMNLDATVYDLQLHPEFSAEAFIDFNGSHYLQDTFPLGALANPDQFDANLFYTNDSHLNGEDVLSGSPYHDRNHYNFIGYGPLDKTLDSKDILSDMVLGVTEYDDMAYKLTNTFDGLGYKIDNHNKQYRKSELVKMIILAINFYIDDNGDLQYHVDTEASKDDPLHDKYSYYVDVALNHLDFKVIDNTILAYITKPIVDESNQVIKMINDAVNELLFTISDAGDIRFNGVYAAGNYALDIARMYEFFPDGNSISYERTDYNPEMFTPDEVADIEKYLTFKIGEDKILAMLLDDNVSDKIKAGVRDLNLTLEDGYVTAYISGIGNEGDGVSYSYELSKMYEFVVQNVGSQGMYALDLARMYNFSGTASDGHGYYERSEYIPKRFTTEETKQIEDNISFENQVDKSGNGKILVMLINEDNVSDNVKQAVSDLNITVEGGHVIADVNGIIGDAGDGLYLTYQRTSYQPAKFTSDEVAEIEEKIRFTINDNKMLIFLADETDNQHIKDAVNDLDLTILPDGTLTTGILYNPVILSDTEYDIAMDTLMFFNWDEYYKRHRGLFTPKDSFRYLRIETKGSPYGYNSGKIIIKDKDGHEITTNNDKWIKIGDTKVDIANSDGISDPYVSSNTYILDLGKLHDDVASITLGDTFIGPITREVAISSDNSEYQPVAVVTSKGGDTISTLSYEETKNKSKWIKDNVNKAIFKVSIKDTTKVSELSLFNFASDSWDSITLIPSGNHLMSYNIDLGTHLSETGVFVARLNATEHVFTLDYAGFDVEWIQNNTGTSIELEPIIFGDSVNS